MKNAEIERNLLICFSECKPVPTNIGRTKYRNCHYFLRKGFLILSSEQVVGEQIFIFFLTSHKKPKSHEIDPFKHPNNVGWQSSPFLFNSFHFIFQEMNFFKTTASALRTIRIHSYCTKFCLQVLVQLQPSYFGGSLAPPRTLQTCFRQLLHFTNLTFHRFMNTT